MARNIAPTLACGCYGTRWLYIVRPANDRDGPNAERLRGLIKGTDDSNQMSQCELHESPATQRRLNPKNRPGI